LGRYVREQKIMSWEEAIRKSSALPAATIGMIDRGLIAVGMFADLVVLDPATVIDRATYEEPALPSIGIRHVLVNGKIALGDGAATGVRGGRALMRGPGMPSRPMSTGTRAASAELKPSDVPIAIAVTQRADARAATGRLAVGPKSGRASLDATQFGVLQTADGWASISGVGTFGDGSQRAFVATLDRQEAPRGLVTLTLAIEGEAPYRRAIDLRTLTAK
jgi:N-acyl-D-amino-acid deacylase